MPRKPMTVYQVLDDPDPEKYGCQSANVQLPARRSAMSKGKAPGFTPELGERLRIAIEAAGGVLAVAKTLEVHKDTPGRWRDGQSKISLHQLEQLAQVSGVDHCWLAFGEIAGLSNSHFDLVQDTVEMVIEVALGLGKDIEPSVLAKAVRDRLERLSRDPGQSNTTVLTRDRNNG
jgi:hypothetical protein